MYSFDNNYAVAQKQFSKYVDDICDMVKEAKKQKSPIHIDERLRLTTALCETWTQHSMQWGAEVVDLTESKWDMVGAHKPFNYRPLARDLERLATVLCQE